MDEEHVEPNAPEPRSTDRWVQDETYYKTLQDELQMLQECRYTLREDAQTLWHHHQEVHTLYQAALNHTGADRDQVLQDFHQAIQEHHDMTQNYQQLLRYYWRLWQEHHQRPFPFKHP